MNFPDAVKQASLTGKMATLPGSNFGYTCYSQNTGRMSVFKKHPTEGQQEYGSGGLCPCPGYDSLTSNEWIVVDQL